MRAQFQHAPFLRLLLIFFFLRLIVLDWMGIIIRGDGFVFAVRNLYELNFRGAIVYKHSGKVIFLNNECKILYSIKFMNCTIPIDFFTVELKAIYLERFRWSFFLKKKFTNSISFS